MGMRVAVNKGWWAYNTHLNVEITQPKKKDRRISADECSRRYRKTK